MITLYQVCFFVGVGFSAVSLLTMFGHGFHSGHIGHGGHGAAHGHGGHAHGHGNTLAKAASEVNHASTPLLLRVNLAAIVVFLACFGGIGLIATQLGSQWIAAALAVIAGLAGSALINRVIGAFARSEKPLEAVTLTGTLANVTMPIRSGGIGEIVYTVGGTRRCSGARSSDDRGIDKGAEVVIRRYEKGIAWVSTTEDFPSSQSVQAPQ
jgi:hypothetical protein